MPSQTNQLSDFSGYLTHSQVVHALGVSSAWVSTLARRGRLSYIPTPLGRLYATPEGERMARERIGHSTHA